MANYFEFIIRMPLGYQLCFIQMEMQLEKE